MLAGQLDITIEKGATFRLAIAYQNPDGSLVNLAGAVARMHIRAAVASATTIATLATGGSGITLGGTPNNVVVVLTAAQTAALTGWTPGGLGTQLGVYDLELEYADGTVERLLEGKVTFDLEVTR